MTTVVNNPAPNANDNGGGFVILAVVILLVVVLFIYYGIPAMRNAGTPEINVPTQIVVPDEVEVNINQEE